MSLGIKLFGAALVFTSLASVAYAQEKQEMQVNTEPTPLTQEQQDFVAEKSARSSSRIDVDDINGALVECRDVSSDVNTMNECFQEKKAELAKDAKAAQEAATAEAAIDEQLKPKETLEKPQEVEKNASEASPEASRE
jgi:hypothetical protein